MDNKVLAGRAPSGRAVVKNRAPASIQITAEQLLVESRERAETAAAAAPRQHVADPAELAAHRLRVRKEFEDHLRRQRHAIATWLRYAKWEDGQGETVRARSVYERALEVDFTHVPTWIRYAEMEMRARFVNRARNVLDRAVGLLPRVDALWLRATHFEEMLGNAAGARVLFERWVTWEPPENAWLAFAKFELRAGEPARARAVYERAVAAHPSAQGYIRYARWEERAGQLALARRVYEVGAEVRAAGAAGAGGAAVVCAPAQCPSTNITTVNAAPTCARPTPSPHPHPAPPTRPPPPGAHGGGEGRRVLRGVCAL